MSDIGKTKLSTNADKIRNMSDEELAKKFMFTARLQKVSNIQNL